MHIKEAIGKPFNAFANRTDPDQTALKRAALSGSTVFANGNMLYMGCSNMNASSFISFITYMLRQNAIPF